MSTNTNMDTKLSFKMRMEYADTDASAMTVFDIGRLTYEQVSRYIVACPAIIVPLGGCEPFGGVGALGAESACVLGIAGEASKRCRVLAAPLIPFGCSVPFISFAGAAGVKPRTFVNMLCEIAHAYVFQGMERIFFISAAPFNKEPAAEAVKRLEEKYPKIKALFFDVCDENGGCEFDRGDAALLSILAHLRPDLTAARCNKARSNTAAQYRAWKRRGRDPQKLRALFPDGLLLPPSPDIEICPDRGKEYFERITASIERKIKAAL